MTDHSPVRWGILGPGTIAHDFLAGAVGSVTGRIVALGSRNPHDPALAQSFPGIRIAGDYDALLADEEVDAVYVATPHSHHAAWTIAALEHGKHVLCEKPLGLSAGEARAMFAASASADRFLAEAYMYRHHPLTRAIIDRIAGGDIGEVRMIRSSFGFAFPEPPLEHRLFRLDLGGGAILDVGGYPVSMARLIAGVGTPDGIAEPVSVVGSAHVGATGVDEWSSALLTFPNGVIAQLSCAISVWQDNVLEIMGTRARLQVDFPWFGGGKAGGVAVIRLLYPDGRCEEARVETPQNLYSFQFEAANRAIAAREPSLAWPATTAADSLANADVLDRWLSAAGVVIAAPG